MLSLLGKKETNALKVAIILSCGGPYPLSECDDKPMGSPKDEEGNYAYGGYRGGGYRGNYYGRSSGN
ncbi:hypothetical protein Tco_0374930 [Tanacetum coccineum]